MDVYAVKREGPISAIILISNNSVPINCREAKYDENINIDMCIFFHVL